MQRCGGRKPELGKTPSLDAIQWHIDQSTAIGAYVAGKFDGGLPIKLEYFKHALYIGHAMKYGRDNDPRFANLSNAEVEREANDTAAFNDKANNRIVIDESKAKPAATLHEVLHSYCSKEWKQLGWRVSEGGTEHFARVVAAEAGIKPNDEYPIAVAAVDRLVKHAGSDAVARAFFQGEVAALRAIVDGKRTAGTFDAWCAATNAADWNVDPLCSPAEAAAEDAAQQARVAANK